MSLCLGGDSMNEVQHNVFEAAALMTELLDSNVSLHHEKCDHLNIILKDIHYNFSSLSSNRREAIASLIANTSSFETLLKFMCKLAERTYVSELFFRGFFRKIAKGGRNRDICLQGGA